MSRSRIHPGDGDPRHGTANAYNNLKCRCAGCRAAWAARCNEARAARVPPPDGDPRHGLAQTYGNNNCRCRPCTNAHAAQRRRNAQRRSKARLAEVTR